MYRGGYYNGKENETKETTIKTMEDETKDTTVKTENRKVEGVPDIVALKNFTELCTKKTVLIVLGGFILVLLACIFLYMVKNKSIPEQVVVSSEPKKTVYKNVLPPGYPPEIPFEKDSKLAQSYTKEYSEGLYQMSTLTSSEKSITSNYDFYKNFLNQDGWVISGSSTNEKMSFLHATKDKEIIEMTFRVSPKLHISSTTPYVPDASILSYIIINIFRK